ncbi:Acyl-CoA synthetase (AMP-forming)/AMP-acid ligase II [Pseudidiomarina planktonica]|uniref:Acyl-CoA synthetase (AMP-forming)/AMP-acid ligase II n=1 Tax=Pseudidiomarina planktonica TaxID=1323738 RepID=A0A1Y6EIF9_9GAMM|nr:class I adenylate-forming enzyme family protein [Pseudidiomarina planktonica]RUO65870.1 long-chain fatty acid--CoA ligase [Pseudidiomarina planktonica]SMQ62159.1 Acyl-CoA synthetase (AMP-forming)/AMP-acid ligase II [Pseudidiomarina planktonica]
MTKTSFRAQLQQSLTPQSQLVAGSAELELDELLAATPAVETEDVVSISSAAALDFIKSLLQYDGAANKLLLLPATADTELTTALQQQAAALPAKEHTQWLLATSGTTGTPKLISHSLNSLTRQLQRNLTKGAELRWGLLYDPARFAGLQVVLQALCGGSALVIPEGESLTDQLQQLIDAKVNALSATPSLWRKLLMLPGLGKLPLRHITLGGESTDQQTLNALKQKFPQAKIRHIYASTEAGVGFSVADGLAGFPASWLDNKTRKPGPDSTLLLRSNEQEQWLDTGDLIEVTSDRVYFQGRLNGTINVGGNKLQPELIESFLLGQNGVADAHVYGQPNKMMGNLVAADVVLQSGHTKEAVFKAIREACRSQFEAWQCPALLRQVAEIETSAAGKKIRQQARTTE